MLAIFFSIAWRLPLLVPVSPTPALTPVPTVQEVRQHPETMYENRYEIEAKNKSSPNLQGGLVPRALMIAVLTGVISSLIVAMFVERMRKPRLALSILAPVEVGLYGFNNAFIENYVALKVRVLNEPLPLLFRWMQRQSARDCRAILHFLREDGTAFIERPMAGRWAGSVQPVPLQGIIHQTNQNITIHDIARLSADSKIDIPAGEQEDLDVVVRFQNAPDAFGWTNESYRYPGNRHLGFRLPADRYVVDIVVRSEGVKKQARFRIENDHTLNEFRLGQV